MAWYLKSSMPPATNNECVTASPPCGANERVEPLALVARAARARVKASQNWSMAARLRLADLLGGLSIVADLGFGLPSETAMRSRGPPAALA
jgi:hypothetical protein